MNACPTQERRQARGHPRPNVAFDARTVSVSDVLDDANRGTFERGGAISLYRLDPIVIGRHFPQDPMVQRRALDPELGGLLEFRTKCLDFAGVRRILLRDQGNLAGSVEIAVPDALGI